MTPSQLLHSVTASGHHYFIDGKKVSRDAFLTAKHGKRQDCFFTRVTEKAVRNFSTIYPSPNMTTATAPISKTARSILEKAGFKLYEKNKDGLFTGIHAFIEPEKVNLALDHFTPRFRSLFVGKANGGYYATSSIHGTFRRYRCRKSHETRINNVFGKGKTQLAAVRDFIANFTSIQKRYNSTP